MSYFDKIKCEIPKKPKIELKENQYMIDLENNIAIPTFGDVKYSDKSIVYTGMTRNDVKTAKKSLKTIKKFTRLLALRDEMCEDSRNFIPQVGDKSYFLRKHSKNFKNRYIVDYGCSYSDTVVYFKTKEDAKLICDTLNEGRFEL